MLKSTPTAKNSIEMLGKLIAFDTTSRNSNLDLIEFAQALLHDIGVETRLTFNQQKTKANLWATIGPKDRGGVVLSGHTDVVPVDGQNWASDPFILEERDGLLYGRGTCDMKGFVACALANAARMQEADLKTPIHFAFSYDEEVGCTGVKGLIDDMRDNLPAPLAVIVGEPTSMQIVGGHKGGRTFQVDVHGTDGHSSLPDLGVNSIMYTARIVTFLHEMQNRFKAASDPANGFTPHYTTIDCGLIEGGTANNIIPAHTKLSWGFRNIPYDDQQAIEDEVRAFIREEIEPPMQAVASQARVDMTALFELPAMMPDEDSAAETLLRHLTGLNQSGRVSYGTEASHFQTAGIPGVIFGPGSIEQAHLPDEFVAVSQMEACHDFIAQLTDWAATHEAIE